MVAVVAVLAAGGAPALAGKHLRSHPIPRLWAEDAACETGKRPADWRYGAPGHPGYGGSYEGGIAFAASTWVWWSSLVPIARGFRHAWDAPAWVQARVAAYGLAHYGRWGCLYHSSVWRWR